MHYIEKALGKPIERISTEDMDEMERVCANRHGLNLWLITSFTDSSSGSEGEGTCRRLWWPIPAPKIGIK
jgi:hypothetical protein